MAGKTAIINKLANKNKWEDINESMVQVLFFEIKTVFEKTTKVKKQRSGMVWR